MIELNCDVCGTGLRFRHFAKWKGWRVRLYKAHCGYCKSPSVYYELPKSIRTDQGSRFVDLLNKKSRENII